MANTFTYDGTAPEQEVQAQQTEQQESLEIGNMLEQEQQQLLAGKYRNAEELERGYLELQSKLGEQQSEPQPQQEQPVTVADKLAQAYQSYNSDKKFDVNNFEDISKEDLIKAFFENSEEVSEDNTSESSDGPGLSDAQVTDMQNRVGGPDQYKQMMEWAVQNFPKSDIEAFDSIIDSGDMTQIAMAVDAVAKRYYDANGIDGNLVQGRAAPNKAQSYRSQAELIAAMNDPRYDTDPAYRNDVMQKLEQSPELQF
jgi:hypothetical protein